jgi:hypothetical protein
VPEERHLREAKSSLKRYRGVAQLAERRIHNPEVAGSSPAPATIQILTVSG